MTREIKFRAWDIEDKEMLFPSDCFSGLGCDYFQIFDKEWCLHNHEENSDICEGENGVLMQYTGLKDKNGNEIYEGDIIKIVHSAKRDYGLQQTEIADIYFDRGGFRFRHRDGSGSILHFNTVQIERGYATSQDVTIIGNIYENPDLIPNKTND